MRGDMHGSIRKTYVKHKTYRKLNICKTSVFPDVAKSWCSKLYGLCAQTDLPSTAPSRWTLTRVPKAFGRRRTRRHDGGFDVAGDVGEGERRNGRDARKHGKEHEPHGQEPAAQDGTDPRQADLHPRFRPGIRGDPRVRGHERRQRLALPGRGGRAGHR